MNIYIDESGSINNHLSGKEDFVIAMICVNDKDNLSRAYKRFVSSNIKALQELDKDKINNKTGKIVRAGGKMFRDGKFLELKGCQFNSDMKRKFLEFFTREDYFDLFIIHLHNDKLSDNFCSNTARGFNYLIKLSLGHFFRAGLLTGDECHLQFDERNERTETKFFLQEYLNTELVIEEHIQSKFLVSYFDSRNNKYIQIADVFANLFYSHLKTNAYNDEFEKMKQSGRLKHIFEFPPMK